MASLETPWNGLKLFEIIMNTLSGKRPEVPSTTPLVISQFINHCWNEKPESRFSARQIVEKFGLFFAVNSGVTQGRTQSQESANQYVEQALLPGNPVTEAQGYVSGLHLGYYSAELD